MKILAKDNQLSNSQYRFLKILEEDDRSEWSTKDLEELWPIHVVKLRDMANKLVEQGYLEKKKEHKKPNVYWLM